MEKTLQASVQRKEGRSHSRRLETSQEYFAEVQVCEAVIALIWPQPAVQPPLQFDESQQCQGWLPGSNHIDAVLGLLALSRDDGSGTSLACITQ